MAELLEELMQLPAALNQLMGYYQGEEGAQRLRIPGPAHPALIGMGASYHAAWVGAYMLRRAGIPCTYMEASDVLLYGTAMLSKSRPILYISQSGSSGEVQPILDQARGMAEVIGITNQAGSPLARRADHLLPMMAGDEQWIASKTYSNTLALLWLIAHRWSSGLGQGGGFEELRALADRMAEIQQHSADAIERLSEVFQTSERVIFLGHGPHAATARQASITLSEWPKLTSLNFGLGAFRHGFIEIADARSTVIIFAPPGSTRASACELGKELDAYGVKVLFIENGRLRGFNDASSPTLPPETELLSPVLDILPIQLFGEAEARRKFSRPGFRYISKVVTRL